MPANKTPSASTRLNKPVLRLSKLKSTSKKSSKTAQPPSMKNPTKKPTQKAKRKLNENFAKALGSKINSRLVIYEILAAVESGAQLDTALETNRALKKLEDRDRRFARLLATTTIRYRGQLEKLLAPLMVRRPFGEQTNANLILLMGAAQILLLKTGSHAAVDSTVELMRQCGFERLCGLANALMRRLTREGETLLAATHSTHNLPSWLQQSWRHYWGDEATKAIAELAMLPPPLDISVKADTLAWAKKLDAKHIDGSSLRREFDGDPSLFEGFNEGAWWVQDAAAALPARLLHVSAGQSVIDLCAAPGGKSAQLIATGGNVTAIDINQKRLNRLQHNLTRLKLEAKLMLCDGINFNPKNPVDAVLVDAPCSATGTIRRRPDILIQKEAPDINRLQKNQWELTTHALSWLKVGGILVYATCSLQPEEGEDVVSAIVDEAAGQYVIDPVNADEAGIFSRSINKDGCLRILPSEYLDIGGVDGFFVARLKCLG